MSRRAADRINAILAAAAKVPGALETVAGVLEQTTEQFQRAERAYEGFHWGRKSSRARAVMAPDPRGIITQLGTLEEIGYGTLKGRAGDAIYVHKFDAPYAILGANRDGELVIVRGGSRYRIESRGIVG